MPVVIESTPEILNLVDALLTQRVVALDTESDSMYHYREKVCLIQIASPGTGTVLVDPLGRGDAGPIGRVMQEPGITKILHGSDFDVTSLKRDFGWTFAGMFDTAIAARFLGWTSFGLAAVVKRELGIEITKDEQTANWSIRPLSAAMLTYAAGDVDYLVEIHSALTNRLQAIGRLDWVLEESAAVAGIHAASELPAPADFMKAGAARKLSGQAMAILRELFAVREATCLELDRPRFKLVSDNVLVDMAIAAPETVEALNGMYRVPVNIRRHPDRWVRAVRAGLESPPVTVEKVRRNWKYDPKTGAAVERLRVWRARTSAELGLDPGILLPNRLVSAVAVAGPADVAQLREIDGIRNWRCDNFGRALVDAAAG